MTWSRRSTPRQELIDAYDAAVVERRDDGKTKIVRKHETPTRVGGVLGGGMGLATGLIVLVRRSTPDKVLPRLGNHDGHVLQTSLSDADEAKLRAAVGD